MTSALTLSTVTPSPSKGEKQGRESTLSLLLLRKIEGISFSLFSLLFVAGALYLFLSGIGTVAATTAGAFLITASLGAMLLGAYLLVRR